MKVEYNEKKVMNCYDLSAEAYAGEFFHELDHKPFDRSMLDRFAALIPDSEQVIEMGCGPGEIANYLCGQGVKNIIGLDLSKEMVKVAKRLNPDITFVQDNILHLKMENNSAFGIVAFYAIVHFTLNEVKIVFKEFQRILKHGGYLLFSFHVGNEKVSVENFLDQPGADADFVFFEIDDILNIANTVDLGVEEVIMRYPYIGFEHESKRAYILLRNTKRGQAPRKKGG